MDFAAIDFETANELSHSACQLGVVVVRGGDIVRRHCWLIRPRPFRFSRQNIAVHGITPDQVREEAEFAELWESIRDVLGSHVLVAHNARFDLGVLRACLQNSNLEIPDLHFTCTRLVARHAWPGQSGYGLRVVADRLGIQFHHHDALEDAICSAKVLLSAAEHHEVDSLEALERRLRLTRGRAGAWGCGSPRCKDASARGTASRGTSTNRSEYGGRRIWGEAAHGSARIYQRRLRLVGSAAEPVTDPGMSEDQLRQFCQVASQRAPFAGRTVVVTGLLRQMQREEAEQLVTAAGGVNARSVTRQTDVLIVGDPDARTLRAGRTKSTKQERAEQLREEGVAIQVITEEEFLHYFATRDVACG